MVKRLLLLFITAITSIGANNDIDWSWAYKKLFSSREKRILMEKDEHVLSKYDTPKFTQLIFSWNAKRPRDGYFRFSAQVRDATTKTWYGWHKMFEWGPDVQKSFYSKTHMGSEYHHVRLELPKYRFADSVQVKVEAFEGANLGDITGLFFSVADYTQFKPEKTRETVSDLPSVAVLGLKGKSQFLVDHPRNPAFCSPVSGSVVTTFLRRKAVDPVLFAQNSYDHGLKAYGSWPMNCAHAYELAPKTHFSVARLSSFADIHRRIANKLPVIVSIRGNIDGGAKEYDEGHLVVVVGWDKKKQRVWCCDSAFRSNDKTLVAYDVHQFVKLWECSRRLTYSIERA